MDKTMFMGLVIGAITSVIVASSAMCVAYAQPSNDQGASGSAEIPGWDPGLVNKTDPAAMPADNSTLAEFPTVPTPLG